MYVLVKIIVSAVLIALISELAKRSALLGAALASIPLVSVLAFIWLYSDTRDAEQVVKLSNGIFWLVLPSLSLFASLPVFVRWGWHFGWSLTAAIVVTVAAYAVMIFALNKFGIKI